MWNPSSPTRRALALLMAAAVAFLGSAILLEAGRAVPQLTGGTSAGGQPGFLLFAVVILVAATGAILLALTVKELLDARRRPHVR